MKKTLLYLGITTVALLLSCNKNTDKKSELEKLKKQRDELTVQIEKLEQELLAEGSLSKSQNIIKTGFLEVKPSEFVHYIEAQGKVDGELNVIATSQVPAIITRIYVKEGDAVKKGQTLAELDASVLYQNLKDLESTLSFVTELYEKQKTLWDQKIGSEVQYLTAKNNKESVEHKIKTLKEQIAMYRIEAPIDGTIEEVPVKIGQAVAPGLVCFRVVNFSSVKVLADISEAFSPKIKQGTEVIVHFPDFNVQQKAKISFASKYINPVNRTFQIEIRLPENDSIEYRANMISVVKIVDYRQPEAISLPVNLILDDQNGRFVYIASEENGKTIARKRKVEEGLIYNGIVEIKSGLKTGDKVLTTSIQDLEDGQLIELN